MILNMLKEDKNAFAAWVDWPIVGLDEHGGVDRA
jgi:hypothetical protein